MKSAKNYLEEANAVVTRISAQEAVAKHAAGGGVFIDVRDSADIAKSGTIAGAHRIPRGFMEFAADAEMQSAFFIWPLCQTPCLEIGYFARRPLGSVAPRWRRESQTG